jgi:hypothetical protein
MSGVLCVLCKSAECAEHPGISLLVAAEWAALTVLSVRRRVGVRAVVVANLCPRHAEKIKTGRAALGTMTELRKTLPDIL